MWLGVLEHPITIMRRVQVGRSSIGEPNWVWVDWRSSVWSSVTARRGREQWDSATKQRFSEEVYLFRVMYEEVIGIDDTMKVSHEGNTFKIKAILPDAQNREDVIIECTLESASLEDAPMTLSIQDEIIGGYLDASIDPITVTVSGGEAPYDFSDNSTLPPGLSIDAGGAITGVPTQRGVYSIVITVSDALGNEESLPAFDLEIF